MAPSDLNLEAQIRRFWEIHFFVTPNNFANGPHFFALTQLRATKTGSKICCTHLSYTFSESWVRKDSVGTCPEKFSHWKFSGTEQFTKKFRFSVSACKQSIGLVKYSFFLWRLPLRKGGATKLDEFSEKFRREGGHFKSKKLYCRFLEL